jgi:hypothetical protein
MLDAHQQSHSQERVKKKKAQQVQDLMQNQMGRQANSSMAQQTAKDIPEFLHRIIDMAGITPTTQNRK